MLTRLWKMLDVEPEETGSVSLLLILSFLMGLFLATVAVASQTLFLGSDVFTEKFDLPVAIAISGLIGMAVTMLYNFLQGRIPFTALAILSLLLVTTLTGFLEFGDSFIENKDDLYFFGFTLILPFTFLIQLVFWGSFNRMFNVRVAKRLVGSVDVGTDIAAILSFFSIPILLGLGVEIVTLYTIGLVSIIAFVILFSVLASKYLIKGRAIIKSESDIKKLSIGQFIGNKYIMMLSLFVIVSIVSLQFVDYSFYNAATIQFTDTEGLAVFLSYFEMTIVIFGFLFTTFITDRINQDYGLRVSLLINPLLLIFFTISAFALGSFFGYDLSTGESSTIIFFFIAISMSKLFVNSLRDALDNPTFKFYYVPIDKEINIDAQTKIEGFVTALAAALAGGLIVLINQFKGFTVLSITLFALPVLAIWYWVTNRMYHGYRETLQNSLIKNKSAVKKNTVKEYTMDSVLEKEVKSTAEEKIIYGLKLMEKLEPALFETSLLHLADSKSKKIAQFALKKIQELGIHSGENEIRGLAAQAANMAEDSDLLSIPVEKLMKLSKSVKQPDRMLAAKLMRKLTNQKTIFILLELMRDADPKVRTEALLTARKVKRPETWNVLIELLSSPRYAHQAASALKEAGPQVLNILETAFHKSGQNDLIMLKLIQIMGHIPGQESLQMLWKKIDYPDKRVVNQILYSLRYINYRATGREALEIKDLLDVEMGKTLWNLAALDELTDEDQYDYLKGALREEIRDNYDQITLLLSLLYDPESVQLVRENVELGTPDSVQYALELLDLFVDQDLKPKLIPLLDDSNTSQKLENLQIYFPRESYNPIQVINYVLNRDFNYNNRWTKVCAVYATAFIPKFRVSRGLISQMFNNDKLLQETTAWVIYNKSQSEYHTISMRLPYKDKRFLDSAIENNQLLDGLDDGFFLFIEMVMLIKKIPVFNHIQGKVLSDLADKILPVTLKPNERLAITEEEMPILIMAHGEAVLKNGETEVMEMKPGSVFGDLFQEGPTPTITEVLARERTVIFKISLVDFYFVLASHHELAQGLIHNITEKQTQPAL